MRLPRDVSGDDLVQALKTFGYQVTRQTGSHIRLTTKEHGEHQITIPKHVSLRVGTLSGILSDIAKHFEISRDELIKQLFP
ncbi:type II toxin-antitoxin system HicA family toxin [Acidobacteria bacterium AH-259-G07]|nr:type II toxin-antitoxin system HicA family toxin [Acidobacteria bacterium AH-259-G07]